MIRSFANLTGTRVPRAERGRSGNVLAATNAAGLRVADGGGYLWSVSQAVSRRLVQRRTSSRSRSAGKGFGRMAQGALIPRSAKVPVA